MQLVATLGPASLHLAARLVHSGATSLRLNASHMTPGALRDALSRVRADLPDTPVVVDLQGAKMRFGTFPEISVSPGDLVQLSLLHGPIQVPHPELFRAVSLGDTLSADDDRLRFSVESVAPDVLWVRCLVGGPLRPRKGINVLEHPVDPGDLSPVDQEHVAAALAFAPVQFAFSFMTDGHEADWVRSRAPGCPVIGKVERQEALRAIDSLPEHVDALWICRGDLGAQLGPAALARWFSRFTPPQSPPTFAAGQVLEHLTSHPHPTRSEVCHLFDLLARGYAGIVLSDETAIGSDPERAVATAAGLLSAFVRV